MPTLLKNKNGSIPWLLGLLTGLYLFTFNIIGFNFEFFPGNLGDGRLNLYFLEHAYKFFTGNVSSFWNAPFMYPEKNVIAYSDNLLGSAPIYSLFRFIGLDIYKSYQLWFIAVSALNYTTAFYFLKYVFKNNYSAVLGAFIFAFSIAIQSQLPHAQTFPRFAIPLAFFMAVKFSEELKPNYFFYTILLVVYQIYCGIYLGFMLVVPIAIYLILIVLKDLLYEKKAVYSLKWLLQVAFLGLLNVIILLPLMLPYMERKITPRYEHFNQISNTIPTILSHFYSHRGSLIWDFLSKTGEHYEASWNHQIFAGGIATICLLIGIFILLFKLIKIKFRINKLSTPLLLLLTGLITFFFYLNFDGFTAYIALYYIPGFNSMRSMTRIINIELIFFAIATAFVFTRFFTLKLNHRLLLFLGALTLLFCDNYFDKNKAYKTKVSLSQERIDKIEREFAQIPSGSLVSYEPINLETKSIYYQLDAMLASQKHNLKSVNGYSATCPGDFGMYWKEPNEKSRNNWLEDKHFTHDSLYVIKATDLVKYISIEEFKKSEVTLEDSLKSLIEYIRSDENWMKEIENKALQRKISVDSMILLDAKWVIENEK